MKTTMLTLVLHLLAQLLLIAPTIAQVRDPRVPFNSCDAATAKAAEVSGVPVNVLMAIARVESGRTVDGVFRPWPWAVNEGGTSVFFESLAEAKDHVAKAMSEGKTNIDVGCFQINIRWHGSAFTSLDVIFDPKENARYAARFLSDLYHEKGSWDAATGAFHSRQTKAASAYLDKVTAMMAMTRATSAKSPFGQAPRKNTYPLLQAGSPDSHGSLVTTAFDSPAIPLFW